MPSFFFLKRERESEKNVSVPSSPLEKNTTAASKARERNAALSFFKLERQKMDDAKENNVVIAAPGKPSWPLPSPSTGGSGGGGGGGGGGVANRKRPSSAAATVVAAAAAAEDETIPTSSRRAVDVLAHMATTAAVRDLAAALEQLAVPGTAEEARRAAERALDGEKEKR